MKLSLGQHEIYDDEADAASYSLALITQGSLLREYEESQMLFDIVPVLAVESTPPSASAGVTGMARGDTFPVTMSISHIQKTNPGPASTAVPRSVAGSSSSSFITGIKPINISVLPLSKVQAFQAIKDRAPSKIGSKPLKAPGGPKSISKKAAKSLPIVISTSLSEKNGEKKSNVPNVELVISSSQSEEGGSCSTISIVRRNSSKDVPRSPVSSEVFTSIKRSISDSKIRLESFITPQLKNCVV